MKNHLLLAALLMGSIGASTAQTTDAPVASPTETPVASPAAATPSRLAVGVLAGGTYSSFMGSDATISNSKYRLGFLGGITADVFLHETVALHPEVLYVVKGSDYADEVRNRRLTTLDVPVLARFYPMGGPGTRSLFLEAGPQASLLLTATNEADENVKSEFNTLTFDFLLGAGYRLAHGLSVGVRYDIGISNLFKPVPARASLGRGEFQSNAKTGTLSATLGYTFGL